MSDKDDGLIRPVGREDAPDVEEDPKPVDQPDLADPGDDDGNDPGADGEAEPARTLTAEQKLKRKTTEAKRLRKESADKDRALAALAQRLEALESKASQGDVNAIAQAEANTQSQITALKAARRKAMDEGDTEAFDHLDEQLNIARRNAEKIEAHKAQVTKPKGQQVRQAPQKNARTEEWLADKDWFNVDRIDTSVAVAVSDQLARDGYAPDSEEHFERLDAELKRRLPHRYQDSQRQRSGQVTANPNRGGAQAPTLNRIPAFAQSQLRRSGHDLDDPKAVENILKLRGSDGRTNADRWASFAKGR